tara:strand:- start:2059 stop:2496 length:438 start_codon:yes stop_codon:yes gene_type:complete
MALDPTVWGPHFWFTLHTIAFTYPSNPNEVTRKKYYDFIQNLPLFLPIPEIGNSFARLLDKYPVTPYLDSRKSFMKWMHFIHNKIRKGCGHLEIDMEEAINIYKSHYIPKEKVDIDNKKIRRYKIYGSVVGILLICSICLIKYNK